MTIKPFISLWPDSIHDWEDGEYPGASEFNSDIRDTTLHLEYNLPHRHMLFHDQCVATMTYAIDASQLFNHVCYVSGAINNTAWQDVCLRAGIYDFYMIARSSSDSGVVTFSLQDRTTESASVNLGNVLSHDLYSAATVNNVIVSRTSVVIPNSARIRVTHIVASKNASSSGYYAYLTAYAFVPTNEDI